MLYRVLARLFVVLAILLAVASLRIVGRKRLREIPDGLRSRIRTIAPSGAVLGSVLLINARARQVVPDLSWIVGVRLTPFLYELERDLLPWIQSYAWFPLTVYFSFVYVYGYVFLLVFPLVAYVAMEDTRPVRWLLWAYTFNYVLGLACYVFVIAYGPRNMEIVEALMYENWPEYQHLTREVNRNTNVFPSLHASLGTTVALLAYRTRETYPEWMSIATIGAVSVAISTMYLGIHWATDVVAGLVLAAVSVKLADVVVADDRTHRDVVAWLRRRGRGRSESPE